MQDGTPIIIKRKKGHKHGHHGGAWKVAYADFVTAMMAFFMVMWIMSLSDKDRQLVQAYFQDPVGFSKNMPKSEVNIRPPSASSSKAGQKENGNAEILQEMKARDQMNTVQQQIEEQIEQDPELSEMLRQQSITTKITEEGLQIELIESEMNGEVFFQIGSAVVRPKAVQVIIKIAPILARTNHAIVVEGHTDNRPYSALNYDNTDLSYDRANQVRHLLRAGGVTEGQIQSIEAYGDTKPRLPKDPAHFSNRRVTILLPFQTTLAKRITELPSEQLRESIEGVFKNPTGR